MKGFDPLLIFVAQLHSIGYSNLTGIFTPQEVKGTLGSQEIVVTSNVQSKKLKSKDGKDKTKQRLKGDSSSHVGNQLTHLPHPNSSAIRSSQRKIFN
jgi:hypothetical protein